MSRFGLTVAALVLLLGTGTFFVVLSLGGEEVAADEAALDTSAAAETSTSSTSTTSSAVTTTTSSTTTTLASTTAPTSSTTTSVASTTSTSTAPTTTIAMPPFSSSVSTPTADQLHASWEPGCPVAPEDLRLLTLSHWNYAGGVSSGQIVVAAGLAADVIDIFADLYEAGFPIERMELVEQYGGDDNASMAANNTSAFNCRLVTGGSSYSEHSYGRAIDINPLVNPYVKGSTILPPAGAAYTDRSLDAPGMIHAGDEVVQAFAARGWIWGGTWSSLKDYQHFSTTGK